MFINILIVVCYGWLEIVFGYRDSIFSIYSKHYQFSNASATLILFFSGLVGFDVAGALAASAVAIDTVSVSEIMSSKAFELMSIFGSISKVIRFSVGHLLPWGAADVSLFSSSSETSSSGFSPSFSPRVCNLASVSLLIFRNLTAGR